MEGACRTLVMETVEIGSALFPPRPGRRPRACRPRYNESRTDPS
ncbi:unnamed protein product [[Actinomadura] parvosata subsp. kistnae]|nr:unnamed protein product [Actinomadura parvosata subsp. kistnae]